MGTILHRIYQNSGMFPDEFYELPVWKQTFAIESTVYQMELDAEQKVIGAGKTGEDGDE